MISQKVRKKIEDADDKNAKHILFKHLLENANEDKLREWCKMAKGAEGCAKMQELGETMLENMPQGLLG